MGPKFFWGAQIPLSDQPVGPKHLLGIKCLWVQISLQGPGLAAMLQASSGVPKSLQEAKPCLCIPNASWDQNPFWGPSLTCGAQNPYGAQIPFGD